MIVGERIMKRISDWESMTLDELFALREHVLDTLNERLRLKNAELSRRMRILSRSRARSGKRSQGAKVGHSDA